MLSQALSTQPSIAEHFKYVFILGNQLLGNFLDASSASSDISTTI